MVAKWDHQESGGNGNGKLLTCSGRKLSHTLEVGPKSIRDKQTQHILRPKKDIDFLLLSLHPVILQEY